MKLGNGPYNWKSTTRVQKKSMLGKVSKCIYLRGFSLLLWLSLTCKEKCAGELEGAGTLRKSCRYWGPGGKIWNRKKTYEDRFWKSQWKMQTLLFCFKMSTSKLHNGTLQGQDLWFPWMRLLDLCQLWQDCGGNSHNEVMWSFQHRPNKK